MRKLADRNDIIITKADKGGPVVIIDVEDYVKKAEHQLKTLTKSLNMTQTNTCKIGQRHNNTFQ